MERLPPPYHNQQQHQHNHPQHRRRHGLNSSLTGGGAIDHRIPAIEKYAFCLCLHVKPTTIFIAAFQLVYALSYVSRQLKQELQYTDEQSSYRFNDINYSGNNPANTSKAVAVAILTRIIMTSASTVAIYAVMFGRAALLMPLYSVLLIDFFFALPSFYDRDVDSALASDGVMGMKNYPATNNEPFDRYSIFISTLVMAVKVYSLCVIWKCYRYLRLIQLVGEMCSQMPNPIVTVLGLEDGTHDINHPSQNVAPPPYDSVASSLKPPNYEEAIKSNNIYTIDVQPHNSQLPNYSSLIAPGTASTHDPAVTGPLTSDEVINFATTAERTNQQDTSGGGQKENPTIDTSGGQFHPQPIQTPHADDVQQTQTTSQPDDRKGGHDGFSPSRS